MIANYHSHTARCNHASGAEVTYVQNAIARGLRIFGFSDHTPQFFPGDYYSRMRMRPHQLEDYCRTVRDLQAEYRGQIQIPLGLEAEFYPGIWHELLPRLQNLESCYTTTYHRYATGIQQLDGLQNDMDIVKK